MRHICETFDFECIYTLRHSLNTICFTYFGPQNIETNMLSSSSPISFLRSYNMLFITKLYNTSQKRSPRVSLHWLRGYLNKFTKDDFIAQHIYMPTSYINQQIVTTFMANIKTQCSNDLRRLTPHFKVPYSSTYILHTTIITTTQ